MVIAATFAGLAGAVAETQAQEAPAADSGAVVLQVALHFEAEGNTEVADALFRYIVEQYPDTEAARTALARLTEATEQQGNTAGGTELRVWSSLFGLWLGVAVPWALDADGSTAFGTGLLLGGPAGYLAGTSYARSRPLSRGQARAITWGGTWGTFQGWGWAIVLDEHNEPDGSALAAAMIAGGLAGIGAGAAISRREISDGVATSASTGSLWGSWFGAAGSHVLGMEGDAVWYSMLLAGNAGLAAGAWVGDHWQLSRRRARLVSVVGVVGGFMGLGLTLIAQPDSDRGAVAIPLLGSIAGLGLGWAVTNSMDDEASAEDGGGRAGSRGDANDGGLFSPGPLLRWSDGSASFGVPLPTPVIGADFRGQVSGRQRGKNGTAWRVPLLEVRF